MLLGYSRMALQTSLQYFSWSWDDVCRRHVMLPQVRALLLPQPQVLLVGLLLLPQLQGLLLL